jgi:hypothetical protein
VIHGPGKDEVHPRVIDEGKGVEVRIAPAAGGAIVYELKVPLAVTADRPYAIGTRPGAVLGVGLEATRLDTSGMRPRMGMRGMGGAMGGGRGGGGRMGGGRPEMPEPLNLWAKVHLAEMTAIDDDMAVIAVDESEK